MKKIALYLFTLGALFTTASCSSDFLNVNYWSIVSPDGVYEDADNVYNGLMGCYAAFFVDNYNTVAPHPVIANQPSLDMQSEGWDAEMTTHSWGVEAKSGFFENLWKSNYKMISRCNIYLADLEDVDDKVVSASQKKIYEAEARALRAWGYYNLTISFSRVPMLMTGETYVTSPDKARPETDAEAWDAIIEDFEYAASVLDWTAQNGEYGRMTKAAALAFAAKAHMYKGEYSEAKSEYEQVINGSGKSLDPCQGMIHCLQNPNSYETIWEISYPQLTKMNWSAGSYSSNYDTRWGPMQNRPDEYSGWGDSPVSYEHIRSYEPGDKRLLYNIVAWGRGADDAAAIDGLPWLTQAQDGNAYMHNIFTDQYIGMTAKYQIYFQTSRSCIPNAHSIKWWHTNEVYAANSIQIYRYTGVLLDYAECCFRTGDAATGWKQINAIRNRAWGNLEVGYDPNNDANLNSAHATFPTEYLNTAKVEVPDAQTHYAAYKAEKGFTSDTWLVAVTQERRKEFLQEFSFWFDLTRLGSDFVKEWLDCEYPKNGGATFYNTKTGKYYVPTGTDKNEPYTKASAEEQKYMIPCTDRDWDWNAIHIVYPIPTSELTANKLCEQNPGY